MVESTRSGSILLASRLVISPNGLAVDIEVLSPIVSRAISFFPGLARMRVIRSYVTLRKVLCALDESGAASLNELKTTTRCGMGWCQGRVCGAVLPPVMAFRRPGFDIAASFAARSPVRPIPATSMAAVECRRD